MDRIALALLNDFQRDFPLTSRPFRILGRRCGTSEAEVLRVLRDHHANGAISRVGAVVAPGCLGAATLSALEVPPARLAAVADAVSALPEINHNYAREHPYNLWFVANAQDRPALDEVLARISAMAGLRPLDLPLVREYHIDLGFPLPDAGGAAGLRALAPATQRVRRLPARAPDDGERRVLHALQGGLDLVAEPFRALAAKLHLEESRLLSMLDRAIEDRIIRRFGVIVRHHELGYRANAMAVWDVPDALVDSCGGRAARVPGVTLAYRRRRQRPAWPYNLFCMVHARARGQAQDVIHRIARAAELAAYPHEVLFSTRRFKQCGAHYRRPEMIAHG